MPQKLENLHVWVDPLARPGVENMAIDELLLQSIGDTPIVRFYQWANAEVSFGYFDKLEVAKSKFANESASALQYVRRWTGGGVVDHRVDTTYTIVLPRSHPWATMRGAASYGLIHEAVVRALLGCGVTAELINHDSGDGSAACFENPVAFDVVDSGGNKLAGAGQRRTRWGLLHQGSVQGVPYDCQWRDSLVLQLAVESKVIDFKVEQKSLESLLVSKYFKAGWLDAR